MILKKPTIRLYVWIGRGQRHTANGLEGACQRKPNGNTPFAAKPVLLIRGVMSLTVQNSIIVMRIAANPMLTIVSMMAIP